MDAKHSSWNHRCQKRTFIFVISDQLGLFGVQENHEGINQNWSTNILCKYITAIWFLMFEWAKKKKKKKVNAFICAPCIILCFHVTNMKVNILIGWGQVLHTITDLLLRMLNVPRKVDLARLRYGTNSHKPVISFRNVRLLSAHLMIERKRECAQCVVFKK